uniref:Uncharacterized protein n=1 Tax=Arundo donax TaxID=35708 RepID=A0A0A9HE12_ARUDO
MILVWFVVLILYMKISILQFLYFIDIYLNCCLMNFDLNNLSKQFAC